MRKIVSKNIFQLAWPTIKQLVEDHGYSLPLAKRKACEMAEIPYALDDGFQRIPEFREWKAAYLARRSGERRWVKT